MLVYQRVYIYIYLESLAPTNISGNETEPPCFHFLDFGTGRFRDPKTQHFFRVGKTLAPFGDVRRISWKMMGKPLGMGGPLIINPIDTFM